MKEKVSKAKLLVFIMLLAVVSFCFSNTPVYAREIHSAVHSQGVGGHSSYVSHSYGNRGYSYSHYYHSGRWHGRGWFGLDFSWVFLQ